MLKFKIGDLNRYLMNHSTNKEDEKQHYENPCGSCDGSLQRTLQGILWRLNVQIPTIKYLTVSCLKGCARVNAYSSKLI